MQLVLHDYKLTTFYSMALEYGLGCFNVFMKLGSAVP